MPNVMKDGLASSPTVEMILKWDRMGEYPLSKVETEQITTVVEVVNYLLKLYATDCNIAKASLNIA